MDEKIVEWNTIALDNTPNICQKRAGFKSKCHQGNCVITFSKFELYQLYFKALEFVYSPEREAKGCGKRIHQLSRCKPAEYYEKIEKTKKKIEEPYIKDPNGHRESPINGKINGLFLTPGVVKSSPFGNKCYEYPIDSLINANLFDIYFADFYCAFSLRTEKKKKNKGETTSTKKMGHKITLVFARKGSLEHRFCEATLIRLPWFSNPLFRLSEDFMSAIVVKENCKGSPLIELFFTEALCLTNGMGKAVCPFGRGKSNPKGQAPNQTCSICNIDI